MTGGYAPLEAHGDVFAYLRHDGGARYIIALNLGAEEVSYRVNYPGRIVLSTYLDRESEAVQDHVLLREDEGVIIEV